MFFFTIEHFVNLFDINPVPMDRCSVTSFTGRLTLADLTISILTFKISVAI